MTAFVLFINLDNWNENIYWVNKLQNILKHVVSLNTSLLQPDYFTYMVFRIAS